MRPDGGFQPRWSPKGATRQAAPAVRVLLGGGATRNEPGTGLGVKLNGAWISGWLRSLPVRNLVEVE